MNVRGGKAVLNNNLPKWRKKRGLTEAELADISGVSAGTIKWIEMRPRLDRVDWGTMRSLSRALNVTPAQLFPDHVPDIPTPEEYVKLHMERLKNAKRSDEDEDVFHK